MMLLEGLEAGLFMNSLRAVISMWSPGSGACPAGSEMADSSWDSDSRDSDRFYFDMLDSTWLDSSRRPWMSPFSRKALVCFKLYCKCNNLSEIFIIIGHSLRM
jgi:hypothetical protein